MTDLWRESVITALFAQEIARLKRRNVESAYLCGLLHRVGMAVILNRVGAAVLKHRLTPDPSQVLQLAARHEARVGTQLSIAWKLPPAVCRRDLALARSAGGRNCRAPKSWRSRWRGRSPTSCARRASAASCRTPC